jgi:hypothetical protein
MPVNIHGKEYKTVAERLEEAHATSDLMGVETEVLYLDPQIMVKATIKTKKGVFTGISAADPNKSIEAKTPVEVAETSAVGRALAFAGYAGSEIASADEMVKAGVKEDKEPTGLRSKCQTCGAEMVEKSGNSNGKPWTGLFCPNAKKGEPGHKPVWL